MAILGVSMLVFGGVPTNLTYIKSGCLLSQFTKTPIHHRGTSTWTCMSAKTGVDPVAIRAT